MRRMNGRLGSAKFPHCCRPAGGFKVGLPNNDLRIHINPAKRIWKDGHFRCEAGKCERDQVSPLTISKGSVAKTKTIVKEGK